MKCKHTGDREVVRQIGWLGPSPVRYECNVCMRCGEWLPLGESNDEPEAVKLEIQLAACLAEVGQLWEPPDQDAAREVLIGAFLYNHRDDTGQLARCIVSHDASAKEGR